MVEVGLVTQIIRELTKYSKGERFGLLGRDITTSRKVAAAYASAYSTGVDQRHVNSFEDWKNEFKKMQEEVDMMLVTNPTGISGWDKQEAIEFVKNNIKIPVACQAFLALPYSLMGFTKVPQEQGEWAAKTALEILAGKSPKNIPVVTNKKAKVYLNMRLAKKLGIKFPMELIERAGFVEEELPQ